MQKEIIAKVEATIMRRVVALASLLGVSGLLFSVALDQGSNPSLKFGGVLFGLIALGVGVHLFRATQNCVELHEDGLWDSGGIRIAPLDDIVAVDRGMMAFKPSNGFLLRTRVPTDRTWRPGLWWRFGKRVGIGGVVPGVQARFMADRLAELIAKREAEIVEE